MLPSVRRAQYFVFQAFFVHVFESSGGYQQRGTPKKGGGAFLRPLRGCELGTIFIMMRLVQNATLNDARLSSHQRCRRSAADPVHNPRQNKASSQEVVQSSLQNERPRRCIPVSLQPSNVAHSEVDHRHTTSLTSPSLFPLDSLAHPYPSFAAAHLSSAFKCGK